MENQIQLQLHNICIINYNYNYNYVIGPGSGSNILSCYRVVLSRCMYYQYVFSGCICVYVLHYIFSILELGQY